MFVGICADVVDESECWLSVCCDLWCMYSHLCVLVSLFQGVCSRLRGAVLSSRPPRAPSPPPPPSAPSTRCTAGVRSSVRRASTRTAAAAAAAATHSSDRCCRQWATTELTCSRDRRRAWATAAWVSSRREECFAVMWSPRVITSCDHVRAH